MIAHESKDALVEGYRQRTILGAALRVAGRRGLPGTTMQEVADEAGIAKGTIYLYFDGRQDLIEKVVGHAFTQLLDRVRSVLEGQRPLPEQLRRLLREQIVFFDENREFLRIYMALRDGDGDAHARAESRRRRRARPQYQRYLELLSGLLAGAMERGEARSFDPARLALFVAEGTAGLLVRRLAGSAPPVEQEVEWLASVLLEGIVSRRPA